MRLFYLIVTFISSASIASAQVDKIQVFEPSKSTDITFTTIANKFGAVVNLVIPLLIGVAIVVFIYGVFQYVSAAGDSEKVNEAKKTLLYALVAIFLMVSFWGFVMIIKNAVFPVS